jgi:hypothetical protein
MDSHERDDVISLTYRPDISQIPDYVIGYRYQAYENHRMMFSRSWDRHYFKIGAGLSLACALVIALIYTVIFQRFSDILPNISFEIFACVPFVALVSFYNLSIFVSYSTKTYRETFVRWNIKHERMYTSQFQVEIGPQGFRQVTNIETIQLSWARYHLAIVQPDNLVLVFHGTVAVIPRDALPIAPDDVVDKIPRWSAAQQQEIKPLS